MTASLSRCSRCGSTDLEERIVEKLLRGGQHVLALRVPATVCHRCGERYFAKEVIEVFESSRRKLERGELEDYQPVGQMLRLAQADLAS